MKRLRTDAIGLLAVVFMGLAGAAPISAMTGNVPVAVGYGDGKYIPGGYVFATVVLTIFAVGYAAMSRHITATGSFYGYISHGLGQAVGITSGLIATVAYIIFEASVIGIFASFARSTVVTFGGPEISWIWYALLGIAVIACCGYFKIELSGTILGVFLVTEVAILLVLGFAVLLKGGGPAGLVPEALNPIKAFSPAPPDPKSGIVAVGSLGLFFAFWSWVGFEATAVYGEESRSPKRIIPQAIIISVVIVGVLYIFSSWMAVAGNGPEQAIHLARTDPFEMYFGITETFVGTWAKHVYKVLIITGSFACALAFHNAACRYIYALGREAPGQAIRSLLGATHHKHQSPHLASIIQSLITLAITLGFYWLQAPTAAAPDVAYSHQYGLLAILGTMLILICQTLCSISVISYFHIKKNHPQTASWWRTFIAPLIGAIGMAYVIWLLFDNLRFAAGAAADSPVFKATPWVAVALIALGLGFSLYLYVRDPDRYRQMGRTVLGDARERA